MVQFSFVGGVAKPTEHTNEKFLLFFLIGDSEVPFYQMTREGLATRTESLKDEFSTKYPVCKLFVSRQGFGIARQYHSFYIQLDPNFPVLKILPFSGESSNFYFKANARFLERKEVLNLLPESMDSKGFYERQEVLPTDLMTKMVFIDRSAAKENIRHIKIKKGR